MCQEVKQSWAQGVAAFGRNGVEIGDFHVFRLVVVHCETVQHGGFVGQLLNCPRPNVVGFEIHGRCPIAHLPDVVFQITRVHFGKHGLQNRLRGERRRLHIRPHFGDGFDKTVFFQFAVVLRAIHGGFDNLRRIIVFFSLRKEQFDFFKRGFRQCLFF